MIQIWRALHDEPKEFINALKKIKYSEKVFNRELKREVYEDYLEQAVSEFVVRRMSRGGMKKSFGWSERERGGLPGDVNAWKTIIKTLPEISSRLQNVAIFNKPALSIINAFDSKNTLAFIDPPYPEESRVSKNVYEHEMTTQDHEKLAEEMNRFRGKAIVCSYMTPLYEELFKDWRIETKKIVNHSSQKKTKGIKTECCFLNY